MQNTPKKAAIILTVVLLAVPLMLLTGCGKERTQDELNNELIAAAVEGNIARVKTLLDEGADINAQNSKGMTPLHIAVESDSPLNVERIVNLGADVNARDNRGWTPLHLAAFLNSTKAISILLDGGANVNARDNESKTPLDVAADYRRVEAAKLLLERGGIE
jgi:ankyrin repeat protein